MRCEGGGWPRSVPGGFLVGLEGGGGGFWRWFFFIILFWSPLDVKTRR